MSWVSADLAVRELSSGEWSVADAAWLLDMEEREVRERVRQARLAPLGKRFDRGRSTRHVRVYAAGEMLRALGLAGAEFGGKVF